MAGRVSCVYVYISISLLSLDFNSTVQWSFHIVICLSQRFTRTSSNYVRSEGWSLMKFNDNVRKILQNSEIQKSLLKEKLQHDIMTV